MDAAYTVTPTRVIGALLLYAGLFAVIRTHKKRIGPDERKTALVVGGLWAVSVFVANWLLHRAGLMSFMPWTTNFLHTFVWIGGCLTFLYLGLRHRESMAVQCVVFATFSLVVKVVEQQLFGIWDHGHFFHLFEGNAAYVVGWSLADGLYPPLTFFGLRALGRHVTGLQVL